MEEYFESTRMNDVEFILVGLIYEATRAAAPLSDDLKEELYYVHNAYFGGLAERFDRGWYDRLWPRSGES